MSKPNSVSMVFTLHDDEKTRKWSTIMSKSEIMADDRRNYEGENEGVGDRVNELLEWGKRYRITFERVEDIESTATDA